MLSCGFCKTRAALLVVVLALLGSSPSQSGELSVVELKAARKIYLGKCAKCHKLHDPAKYTDEKWDEWMGKMTKKSKLKPRSPGSSREAKCSRPRLSSTSSHP